MNAPTRRRFACPVRAVEVLIGLTIGGQRGEVGARGIGKPDDGRKPAAYRRAPPVPEAYTACGPVRVNQVMLSSSWFIV